MTPREKVEAWFRAEFEELAKAGASPDLINEPAFKELIWQRVFKREIRETLFDDDLNRALGELYLQDASIDRIRVLAAQMRKTGDRELGELANKLEEYADSREECEQADWWKSQKGGEPK